MGVGVRLGGSLALPREDGVMGVGVRLGRSLALPREEGGWVLGVRLGGSLALPNGWEGVSAGDAQPESNECAARNSAGVRTGQAPEAGKWRTFRLTRQSAAICNALLY